VQAAGRLNAQLGNAGSHHRTQHALPLAHQTFSQRMLQNRQAAGFKQRGIAGNLGNQAFLSRHCNDVGRLQTQNLGRQEPLPVDLRFNLFCCAEGVPQRVDFVQHHQPRVACGLFGNQVLAPDCQIRFRHTRVGSQDEYHRMCLRNQADRQFRFGANCIQSGRVQDHQALLEQWVRKVDEGVTPHGYFNQPVGACAWVVFRAVVVPETQRPCFCHRDIPNLCHFFEGIGQLCRVVDVQVHTCPLFRSGTPFHQGLGLQARRDRQQAQARRHVTVPAQLCWTHGCAAGAGGHDAAAVTGKKDRVDQF